MPLRDFGGMIGMIKKNATLKGWLYIWTGGHSESGAPRDELKTRHSENHSAEPTEWGGGGAPREGGLSASLRPIFPAQALHSGKFPGIRSYQRQSSSPGLTRDEDVVGADWLSDSLE